MLWTPQKGIVRVEHNTGTAGTLTPGTAVTTHASATTKGSYATLIASTSFDAYWVTIIASGYGASGVASDGCLDIAVGAATEEVLIPNLLMGQCGGLGVLLDNPKRWDFPLYIPAGTAISARAAGRRGSTAFRVWIFLYGGDGSPHFRVGSKVTTYGITVPGGVSITPGTSGGEGAWAQITASTSESHFALVPSFQAGNLTGVSPGQFAVDLGVGAATEEEIAQSFWYRLSDAETCISPTNIMPCFQDIPSGTRLTMRASCSDWTGDTLNGAIHAVS